MEGRDVMIDERYTEIWNQLFYGIRDKILKYYKQDSICREFESDIDSRRDVK